jgi:5-methylcytosine-specific restriction endonuclease McrA
VKPEVADKIKREYLFCFKCGGHAEEIHHVWGRDKQFKKYLDMPENLIMLCHTCNVINKGSVENKTFRQKVWNHKVKLGYKMSEWVDSIDMIIKDRFPLDR